MEHTYWVYVRPGQEWVRIHRNDCRHCNNGEGKNPNAAEQTYRCLGPYDSYEAALGVARSLSNSADDCQSCINAGRIP